MVTGKEVLAVAERETTAMDEMWKPVVGYEGLYEVSNKGNVRSLNRTIPYKSQGKRAVAYGKQLHAVRNKAGYCRVNLCNDGKHSAKFVHRLVAEAFIENPANLREVNHKDENPSNNVVENLEWCDSAYNNKYGTRTQRQSESMKGKNAKAVIAYSEETGNHVWFKSLSDAAAFIQKDKSYIGYAIKNPHKAYSGYYWRRAND